jgi:hypothetical protein
MLAAPPAAAMTYVNDSRGLEPSVYGGGGSPSSTPLPDASPLVSRGNAALVSVATLHSASSSARVSSKEGAGAVARSESQTASVMALLTRWSSDWGGK